MFLVWFEKRWFTLPIVFALVVLSTACRASTDSLTADEIIQRATSKAQTDSLLGTAYTYTKISVTDQLDPAGKIREHKEKVWQVLLRNGSTSVKLLEVNGRPPSPADLKKQNENELNLRQVLGGSKSVSANRDNFLTPELAARFDFKLSGMSSIGGRPAY